MIFSSVFFIFVFLPITLLIYFVIPKWGKNAVLLICSMIFYAWGEPVYIVLMVVSIVYNYISGIEIDYYRGRKNTRRMRFVPIRCVHLQPGGRSAIAPSAGSGIAIRGIGRRIWTCSAWASASWRHVGGGIVRKRISAFRASTSTHSDSPRT